MTRQNLYNRTAAAAAHGQTLTFHHSGSRLIQRHLVRGQLLLEPVQLYTGLLSALLQATQFFMLQDTGLHTLHNFIKTVTVESPAIERTLSRSCNANRSFSRWSCWVSAA